MVDVTVIIPTYNQEKYISETILSICSQDETNFKYNILVLDDASADATVARIKDVQNIFPGMIRLIERPKNVGVVRNVFYGIELVDSEYIALCGGDDLWMSNFISSQMSFISKTKVPAAYAIASTINSNGDEDVGNTFGKQGATFDGMISGNKIPACTVVLKTDLAKSYLSEIDPVSRGWLMEDYPFWLWVALRHQWGFNKSVIAKYRVLDESLSHSVSYSKRIGFSQSRFEIIKFFLEQANMRGDTKFEESYLFHRAAVSFNLKNIQEIDFCQNEALNHIWSGRLSIRVLFVLFGSYFPKLADFLLMSFWSKRM